MRRTTEERSGEFLTEFVGLWDVRRVIVDHRADAVYHFAGRLQLTEDAFAETGKLRMPRGTVAAERAYRLHSADSRLDVLFSDGRPFVTLGARASQAVRHDCGADLYLGRIICRSTNDWAEYWRVAGPAKRYASFCRYRRAAGG
ncbi:DUF6314 family protein [Aureimonas leprariae]|uniref:DUF6314 domain-containing protein n=1 Tax=Plantimonas leprariae TaxID=2615207 RepID=A0A7V7TVE3_9HYPH|nr:DUF6314 family protein [Aureimonas leprariae]KAB0677739.1 hypothetical protein F6X38_17305 [Aureimonas leprariae]